ncbi:hypothetical protein DYH09_22305 [bacterium CPR1]|nr:hypothetical protein [bacterium CPR1]
MASSWLELGSTGKLLDPLELANVGGNLVDGELVVARPGDFYGGSVVNGPFTGGPGTTDW